MEYRNSDPIVTIHPEASERNAELDVGGQGEEPSLAISAVRAAEVLAVLIDTESSSCCLPTEQADWVRATYACAGDSAESLEYTSLTSEQYQQRLSE